MMYVVFVGIDLDGNVFDLGCWFAAGTFVCVYVVVNMEENVWIYGEALILTYDVLIIGFVVVVCCIIGIEFFHFMYGLVCIGDDVL